MKKGCLWGVVLSFLSFSTMAQTTGEILDYEPLKPEEVHFQFLRKEAQGEAGEAPCHSRKTLVLVHGVTDDFRTFSEVAQDLAKSYDILIYDQRGHGKTVGKGENYSLDVMSEDLKNLLDFLKIEKAYLLGHSLGARTALKFASRFPGRTQGLIVEDMVFNSRSPLFESSIIEKTKRELKGINTVHHSEKKALKELIRYRCGNREEALQYLECHTEKKKTPFLFIPRKTIKFLFDPMGVFLYSYLGNAADLGGDLARLKVPALFLRGEQSSVMTGAGLGLIQSIRPDIPIVNFKTGHNIHKHNPREFLNQVREFLNGH